MDYQFILFSLGWAMLSSAWAMLSIPWALSQLGWVMGPIILLLFSITTFYTTHLLSSCLTTKDQNYIDLVIENLSSTELKVFKFFKHVNRVGAAFGMNVTASKAIMSITRYYCLKDSGANENDACLIDRSIFMVIFCLLEIILSHCPTFEKHWLFSSFAAVMSLIYSTIGLILGANRVLENGVIKGNVSGVNIPMPHKEWTSFQAIGNIAFGFSYFLILIDIKEKLVFPPESKILNTAALISVLLTTIFYMSCGTVGYAAFGEHSTVNILTEFDIRFHNHLWLLYLAYFAIFTHLLGAFQVFCRPIYVDVERAAAKRFPNSDFINKDLKIYLCTSFETSQFKLVWRTAFVITATIISMQLPYFNNVIGFIGAVTYCPLTVYFPVRIYLMNRRIPRWSSTWIYLLLLNFCYIVICFVVAIASLGNVISDISE